MDVSDQPSSVSMPSEVQSISEAASVGEVGCGVGMFRSYQFKIVSRLDELDLTAASSAEVPTVPCRAASIRFRDGLPTSAPRSRAVRDT